MCSITKFNKSLIVLYFIVFVSTQKSKFFKPLVLVVEYKSSSSSSSSRIPCEH